MLVNSLLGIHSTMHAPWCFTSFALTLYHSCVSLFQFSQVTLYSLRSTTISSQFPLQVSSPIATMSSTVTGFPLYIQTASQFVLRPELGRLDTVAWTGGWPPLASSHVNVSVKVLFSVHSALQAVPTCMVFLPAQSTQSQQSWSGSSQVQGVVVLLQESTHSSQSPSSMQ